MVLSLTQKNQSFTWNLGATEAFESIKSRFISNPILIQVKPPKAVILESYVVDFALKLPLYKPMTNDKFMSSRFPFMGK